jgi:DNA modification methylase
MRSAVVRLVPGLTVHLGDARVALARLEPASVDCCVTSPPYWGLRNYGTPPLAWGGRPGCRKDILPANANTFISRVATDGRRDAAATNGCRFCPQCGAWLGHLGLEPTPDLYVQHLVDVFRGVRHVLKPGGTLWINLGDSYTSGGRDTRDPGSSKLHPAFLDGRRGDRPPTPPGLKPKDLVGIPWLVAFALRADGWWLRSDIVWSKPNPMPESVRDRPTRTHEYLFRLANSERYYYDANAVKEPCASGSSDIRKMVDAMPRIGSKHKNFEDPFSKASSSTNIGRRRGVGDPSGRNRRSVWTIATQPYRGAHFATYPERLVEPCILAGSRPGGTVLDPFAGSGTTLAVALRLGRAAIGIELKAQYVDLVVQRVRRDRAQAAA